MAGPTQEGEPGKAWGAVWRSERWQVGFLCFYGFVAQLRPGESFITPYLLSQNFTHKQVRVLWGAEHGDGVGWPVLRVSCPLGQHPRPL